MLPKQEIGRLLAEAGNGGPDAFAALVPLVYDELHALAHRQLGRFRAGETLNTTALVHEAYLKMVGPSHASWKDQSHFFTVAALAMRQVVVDYARKRRAGKRGGGAPHTVLDEWNGSAVPVEAQADVLLALDEALTRLAALDERLVRVVELRFFGGLSVEETARVLGVSTATVKRETQAARAFLYRELDEPGGS